MDIEAVVIRKYLASLEDFMELNNISLVEDQSDVFFKVYKVAYRTTNNTEEILQLEINLLKEKLSFGYWKSSAMQTIKYNKLLGSL